MSHIVTFKGKTFTSLDLLTRAFKRMHWDVVANAHIRTYEANERERVFPWVAVNPTGIGLEHYDVGLVQNKEGAWTLNGDFSMSNIHKLLSGAGKNKFELLQMNYNREFVEEYAYEHEGAVIEETVLADGTIAGVMEVEIEA